MIFWKRCLSPFVGVGKSTLSERRVVGCARHASRNTARYGSVDRFIHTGGDRRVMGEVGVSLPAGGNPRRWQGSAGLNANL